MSWCPRSPPTLNTTPSLPTREDKARSPVSGDGEGGQDPERKLPAERLPSAGGAGGVTGEGPAGGRLAPRRSPTGRRSGTGRPSACGRGGVRGWSLRCSSSLFLLMALSPQSGSWWNVLNDVCSLELGRTEHARLYAPRRAARGLVDSRHRDALTCQEHCGVVDDECDIRRRHRPGVFVPRVELHHRRQPRSLPTVG